MYDGEVIEGKVFRVFASRSRRDGQLWKVKQCNPFKIANTPEKCFIVNENIESAATPRKLNKQWYIDIANKRINDFKGVKTA